MAAAESSDFTSFTELDWQRQEEADEATLGAVLNAQPGQEEQFNFSRPLEIGEKADDAEDYEDISDDDLPEEEEVSSNNRVDVPPLTDDGGSRWSRCPSNAAITQQWWTDLAACRTRV
jgi:hypothetical protein